MHRCGETLRKALEAAAGQDIWSELIMNNRGFRGILDANGTLDAALTRHMQEPVVDAGAVARVLARLTPLPRQRQPFWRLPGIFLDWQFAPAWPRIAALAGCAIIGFVIGIADPDRSIGNSNAQFAVASRTDVESVVFDPESPAGVWP